MFHEFISKTCLHTLYRKKSLMTDAFNVSFSLVDFPQAKADCAIERRKLHRRVVPDEQVSVNSRLLCFPISGVS